MRKIISIVNQKGGVGKTTTAINLGASLANFNRSVLLIDLDSQGNSSRGLGIDISLLNKTVLDALIGRCSINQAIKKTIFSNIDIIPSNIKLSNLEGEAKTRNLDILHLLSTKIKDIKHKYDYILIDCPPNLGTLSLNALIASDSALIPVQCEYFAMEGLAQVLSSINGVQTNYNPNLKIEGILLTMLESRSKLGQEVVEQVRCLFRESTYNVVIPRNVSISEASAIGMPVLKYKPTSAGSQAYIQLAREVMDFNEWKQIYQKWFKKPYREIF